MKMAGNLDVRNIKYSDYKHVGIHAERSGFKPHNQNIREEWSKYNIHLARRYADFENDSGPSKKQICTTFANEENVIEKHFGNELERINRNRQKNSKEPFEDVFDYAKNVGKGKVESMVVVTFGSHEEFIEKYDKLKNKALQNGTAKNEQDFQEQFVQACSRGMAKSAAGFNNRNKYLKIVNAVTNVDENKIKEKFGAPHIHEQLVHCGYDTYDENGNPAPGSHPSLSLDNALEGQFQNVPQKYIDKVKKAEPNLKKKEVMQKARFAMFNEQESQALVDAVGKELNKTFGYHYHWEKAPNKEQHISLDMPEYKKAKEAGIDFKKLDKEIKKTVPKKERENKALWKRNKELKRQNTCLRKDKEIMEEKNSNLNEKINKLEKKNDKLDKRNYKLAKENKDLKEKNEKLEQQVQDLQDKMNKVLEQMQKMQEMFKKQQEEKDEPSEEVKKTWNDSKTITGQREEPSLKAHRQEVKHENYERQQIIRKDNKENGWQTNPHAYDEPSWKSLPLWTNLNERLQNKSIRDSINGVADYIQNKNPNIDIHTDPSFEMPDNIAYEKTPLGCMVVNGSKQNVTPNNIHDMINHRYQYDINQRMLMNNPDSQWNANETKIHNGEDLTWAEAAEDYRETNYAMEHNAIVGIKSSVKKIATKIKEHVQEKRMEYLHKTDPVKAFNVEYNTGIKDPSAVQHDELVFEGRNLRDTATEPWHDAFDQFGLKNTQLEHDFFERANKHPKDRETLNLWTSDYDAVKNTVATYVQRLNDPNNPGHVIEHRTDGLFKATRDYEKEHPETLSKAQNKSKKHAKKRSNNDDYEL